MHSLHFIWLAFILCLFFVWYFSHRASHRERLLKIEKGINIDDLDKKKPASTFPWRKIGIMVIGLSVGLLVITLMVALEILNKGGNALPLAILGFFGGISMIIASYSTSDKSND